MLKPGFHVLDYQPDDQYEILVGSLDAPVARRLNTSLVYEKEGLPVFYIELKV